MTVENMAWQWGWAVGPASASLQVNFAPTEAVARCSLSQADGDESCAGGITQYRTRRTPSGADHDHDFTVAPSKYWLPSVAHDRLMTSVSAELDVSDGTNQQGTLTLMVALWN